MCYPHLVVLKMHRSRTPSDTLIAAPLLILVRKKNLLFQTSIAFGVLVLFLFIMYEAIITAPSRHIYDSEEESGAQSAVMMFLEFLYFMFYRLTLCRHRRGKEFLVGVYATLIQSIARILYNK